MIDINELTQTWFKIIKNQDCINNNQILILNLL